MHDAGPVAVFGGTFNPIHFGHLRSAVELLERFELAQVRLVPSARPPHRDAPDCSAEHRANKVELALRGEKRLVCDRRELAREGLSYTIDTLAEVRDELGAGTSVSLVLGYDAVALLDTWHRWRELLDYAHLLVIARPGWAMPAGDEAARWLRQHAVSDWQPLRDAPAGRVLVQELRALEIASSDIRALLAAGRSPRYLLPEAVRNYIESHSLYHAVAGSDVNGTSSG